MSKLNTKIRFTYEDYKSLPESETKRYELLERELIMVPSPSWLHQTILKQLFRILDDYVTDHGLGEARFAPLDVILSEETALQPDIIFILKGRVEIIAEEGVQGAPDLVIEILSPATAERDRTYKKTLYARYGVREYWLVDPDEKTVEVMGLGKGGFEPVGVYKRGEHLKSPLLKGLSVELEKVF